MRHYRYAEILFELLGFEITTGFRSGDTCNGSMVEAFARLWPMCARSWPTHSCVADALEMLTRAFVRFARGRNDVC